MQARVVGLFTRFPGFPQGVDLVANLTFHDAATRLNTADYFLARTADSGSAGRATAVASLRAGPGAHDQLIIDTTRSSLDKDRSSLTALNVRGLVDLDSMDTLLMAAAGIAIFVFGLMLQRRRDYLPLRARGRRASCAPWFSGKPPPSPALA